MSRLVRIIMSCTFGAWLVLAFAVGAWAKTEATVIATHNKEYGNVLTDSNGRSLYIFAHDKKDQSNCYQSCEKLWPPFLIKSGQPTAGKGVTAKLGTITRKDGSKQVTANGMPLYYFSGDKKPGEVNGQGVNHLWWLVSPAGHPIKTIPKHLPSTGAGGMATRNMTPLYISAAGALLFLALGAVRLRRAH